MELETINNFEVKPIKIPALPSLENIAGSVLFPAMYINCFLCAKKNSGKTVALSNIIFKSINKKTSLIFFVSTASKDSTYQSIFDRLDEKDINYSVYNDIYIDGVNIIDKLIDGLLIADPEVKNHKREDSKKKEKPLVYNLFDTPDMKEAEEVKEKKIKKKAPKYIIVIDDMSNETRNPCIARLLKIHRHLKASVFISSQNCNDLTPSAFRQLDYLLIFRGLSNNIEKLTQIHSNMDLPIELDTFIEVYRDATMEPYNFLWCSKDGSFRKNFNKKYILQ